MKNQNDYNQFAFVGRLTKDAKLEKRGGLDVATICVAVNRVRKDIATGNLKEEAYYFYTDILGETAVNLAPFLSQGKKVLVSGYIAMDSYETVEDKRRSIVTLRTTNIQLL